MKKIMFNDAFILTKLVIAKKKTVTRRTANEKEYSEQELDAFGDPVYRKHPEYEAFVYEEDGRKKYLEAKISVGETVAVCQSYKSIIESEYIDSERENEILSLIEQDHIGCTNKMYVRAELMPHTLTVNRVRFERLQDITDDECIDEGIMLLDDDPDLRYGIADGENVLLRARSPREAFAKLIDKISGTGTWKSNPWQVVYNFIPD